MAHSTDRDLRQQIVELNLHMITSGLSPGTSGNLSARVDGGMLITPSGVAAEAMTADDVVLLSLEGRTTRDSLRPSSEWEMHARIYRQRSDARGIVHCHSPYATILSCARKSIPAVHYMIGVTGAYEIPCSDYATPTTANLAEAARTAIAGGQACLLANHGQITLGNSLTQALSIAAEVEALAKTYWGCLAIGGAVLLDDAQMDEVMDAFDSYGQRNSRH